MRRREGNHVVPSLRGFSVHLFVAKFLEPRQIGPLRPLVLTNRPHQGSKVLSVLTEAADKPGRGELFAAADSFNMASDGSTRCTFAQQLGYLDCALPSCASGRKSSRTGSRPAAVVRGGVAGGAIRACSDHGGGIARWSDGADEGRGAAGEACRNAGSPPSPAIGMGCGTVSYYDCEGERLPWGGCRKPRRHPERDAERGSQRGAVRLGPTRHTTTGAIWMSWRRRLTAARIWSTSFMRSRQDAAYGENVCGDERNTATCYGMSPVASSG